MHHWLLFYNFTAVKQLIYGYLEDALSVYTSTGKILRMESRKIPLYKGVDDEKIVYISGAALQLAKFQNLPAIEIARGIAVLMVETSDHLFSVQIFPPGSIHLELTNSILAAWLQNLTFFGLSKIATRRISCHSNSVSLFSVQYAHARCCGLLRLAHQEGLIKLREEVVDDNTRVKSLLADQSIPWLNSEGKLQLQEKEAFYLLSQLVQIVDDLVDGDDSINWEKAAQKLSQAFESFWCHCRIWGEVKINLPELAQTRLGLLIATQLVLRLVLEAKLGVVAPLEL